jgi:nicotinate dehydrogenase subunit B
VAHDCGQIINPDGLVKCVEGNIVQGVSRAPWEDVTFDRNTVTSIDWITYPILDITETPGQVDVVLINLSGHRSVWRWRALDTSGRRRDR